EASLLSPAEFSAVTRKQSSLPYPRLGNATLTEVFAVFPISP
ncbi:hypothetical protein HRED_10342, partial [Candidatus Haloredivivus sp. G17]